MRKGKCSQGDGKDKTTGCTQTLCHVEGQQRSPLGFNNDHKVRPLRANMQWPLFAVQKYTLPLGSIASELVISGFS